MLKLDSISKSFDEKPVLQNISLEIEEGERFSLLGQSGCGKSTLLRLIAGFESPDQGKIWIEGNEVSSLPVEQRPVGLIFQNYALFQHMTVYENIKFWQHLFTSPIKEKEIDIGSVASGGRYNSLIKRFKGADYKGTGMSIGVDRLVFALNQLDQIKIKNNDSVLVCILDEKYISQYYEILNQLRENNINSEIYLDPSKNLKKQLIYADKKGCALAIICGQEEFENNKLTIKKLKSSKENDQIEIKKENFINEIKKLI